MKYDIVGDWQINLLCNYRCAYCYVNNKTKSNPKYDGHNIYSVINAFNKTKRTWLIHMSGGEPFLQPNFIELCQKLTKKHYISINTNLSHPDVYKFAEKINPERVAFVHASLHINQLIKEGKYKHNLNKIETFADKIKYLEKFGLKAYASQVMYPPIINNFDYPFEKLKELGVLVRPKVFRGYYKSKRYPQSYTEWERELFMKYYDESEGKTGTIIDPNLDKHFLDGDLSFRDSKCAAGKDFVVIVYNGDVLRCAGEPVKLGNIFDGYIELYEEAKPCNVKICTCPYYGLKYANGKPKIIENGSIKDKLKYMVKKVVF